MKKIFTFRYVSIATFVLLVSGSTFAQNVGIGQAAPKSKLDVNGNLQVGANYSGVTANAAPANGARIEGQTVINKASGEDSRDKFSAHTSATAYSNILSTSYPNGTAARAIAGYADANGMGVLGLSAGGTATNSGGYGVVGLTQLGALSAFMQGGEGVYGQADGSGAAGTLAFQIGVHGMIHESGTTNSKTAVGILGENNNATVGTGLSGPYGSATALCGLYGNFGEGSTTAATVDRFHFGIIGDALGAGGTLGDATGGVMGTNSTASRFGILGYMSVAGVSYSVYGGGTTANILAANTGRLAQPQKQQANNHIGLGIVGDAMGGYVAGANYGLMSYGKDFGMYVQGKTITNAPIIQLTEGANNTRVVSYAPMSTSLDITTRGKAQVRGTETFIAFDANFLTLVADPTEATITVTPTGESNGVFISAITPTGFYVKENNSGKHDVQLNWIAVAKSKQTVEVNTEIMQNDFDKKMFDVMTVDQTDTSDASNDKSMYYDGTQMQFGRMPAEMQEKQGEKQNPNKKAKK
jgi:hypothetical protein